MDDSDVFIEPEESEQDFVISTERVVVTDYSIRARRVLQAAEAAAVTAPGGVTTCEHLLLSLVGDESCAAAQVLTQCGFTSAALTHSINFIAGPQPVVEPVSETILSPRVERVLTNASAEAGNRKAERIDTLHLLFALIRERQGIAATVLETPGVGHETIGAALSNAMRNGTTDHS